jgi:hypothetical protein
VTVFVATLGSVCWSVVWILRLISAIFLIFSMRRDARNRFARIVSHGVPKLLLASFTFRSRRRDVRCRDARRRFFNVVSMSSRVSSLANLCVCYSTLNMVSYVASVATGVATLLVGSPASCHMASEGFSWLGLVF